MSNIPEATRAPVEYKVGDRVLELHPLTLTDLGWIEQWMRRLLISAAKDVIAEDSEITVGTAETVLAEAYKAAMRISVTSRECAGFLRSPEGQVRVAWLSLRRGRVLAQATLDEVAALFSMDLLALAEVFSAVFEVSGLSGKPGQKPAEGEPSQGESKSL